MEQATARSPIAGGARCSRQRPGAAATVPEAGGRWLALLAILLVLAVAAFVVWWSLGR